MSRTHCTHCGNPLPGKALACPECGSDESTGWADETTQREAAFGRFTDEDYEDVIRDLADEQGNPRRTPRERIILIVAALAAIAFLVTYVL